MAKSQASLAGLSTDRGQFSAQPGKPHLIQALPPHLLFLLGQLAFIQLLSPDRATPIKSCLNRTTHFQVMQRRLVRICPGMETQVHILLDK